MAMKFSELIQRLYPYCGGDDTTSEFVTTILEKVIFNIDNDDLTKKVAVFNMDDNDLRKIYSGKKGISKPSARYILSHLDENGLTEYICDRTTDDARILLCEEFEPYVGNADKDNIANKIYHLLVEILKSIAMPQGNTLPKKSPAQISDFEMERELTEIVQTLAQLPPEQLDTKLIYNSVNVDKKIISDTVLKSDVRKYVIDYYVFVEGLFKNAARQNSAFFDELAKQVKFNCDIMISQNVNQEVVFDKMVAWLKSKVTFASDTACRIIISFFVQNCEVFHAISE